MQPGDNSAKNRLTITSNYNILILSPKEQEMQVSCSRFADYNSDQDLASVENELLKEINKQIVQDIINKLLSNW
jgi:outer membrane lipopolysaccharide assembly protein LptE/RlpB